MEISPPPVATEGMDVTPNSDLSPSQKRKRSRSEGISAPGAKRSDMEVGTNGNLVTGTEAPVMGLPVINAGPASQQPQWQKTIEKAILSIVSIRFSQIAAFDTDAPETSEASGFVVDAKAGLILTNRHVACSGPFVGEAVFHDHEEVDVYPVYRDPVHDFGILKFDPKKIRYMQVTDIQLAPDLAQVGLDVRVVGNDAGEKLSILAGSISRLDRNAPEYGEMSYNDFNTFYLQAASSTSGGSSGSPVLNIEGKAVALQAGGHMRAATDFFFPLDRVARALKFIQAGDNVPRGSIQVQFIHRPFDEVRRLGLQESTEAYVRKHFPAEVGLLVAEVVVPKGPAAAFLEEGDVLLSINDTYITKFVPLEETLDSNVGKDIIIKIQRGGVDMTFTVNVNDLHSITPDRYVEVGGAKVNNVSYQLARQFCVPVEGVYVAEPAGMFRLDGADHGWIISSVDTKPTPNLEAFIDAIKTIPDRERVPVEYYSILDVHTKSVAVVSTERHWSSFRLAVRNDKTGLWDFTDLGAPPPPRPLQPMTATFPTLDQSLGTAASLFHSLVKVSMYIPCRIEGFPKSRKMGAGLVVDAEKGLVVVGRNIVPFTMGDILLTFADSIIIPGKAVFLHPTQNFAIVSYDPRLAGKTSIKSAPFSPVRIGQGHRVSLVALNHNQRPVAIETTVTDITTVTIPYSGTPRFRAINFDAITLDTPLAQQCSAGVLVDADGGVQGLWLSYLGERTTNGHDTEYHLGIGIDSVKPVLKRLREGQSPKLRGLAVEITPVQMSQARHMGLSEDWVRKVEESNPERRQLFLLRRTENGSATATMLKDLDLILAVNGKTITRVQELELHEDWGLDVEVTILRKKAEMTLRVPTTEFDNEGIKRVVFWAGACLHEPHRAVLQQSKNLPSQIYVSGRAKGSPSYMYGIVPTQWITAVNGHPVTTLDDFVEAVRGLPDNEYVRIKTISFDLVPCVLSIKLGLHYWPTCEMIRDPDSDCGWRRVAIQ
ncbi:trypsin-like cysteine/serine peptidase domain-containing protein [Phlyctochytrium arcticum]|nr:trypsin-like cysteine/serine peptidase domain-containing protein [Phlyctochytrium arcticum]